MTAIGAPRLANPKGLNPVAQGWRADAPTLGHRPYNTPQP